MTQQFPSTKAIRDRQQAYAALGPRPRSASRDEAAETQASEELVRMGIDLAQFPGRTAVDVLESYRSVPSDVFQEAAFGAAGDRPEFLQYLLGADVQRRLRQGFGEAEAAYRARPEFTIRPKGFTQKSIELEKRRRELEELRGGLPNISPGTRFAEEVPQPPSIPIEFNPLADPFQAAQAREAQAEVFDLEQRQRSRENRMARQAAPYRGRPTFGSFLEEELPELRRQYGMTPGGIVAGEARRRRKLQGRPAVFRSSVFS
jgi:hypothetical protein